MLWHVILSKHSTKSRLNRVELVDAAGMVSSAEGFLVMSDSLRRPFRLILWKGIGSIDLELGILSGSAVSC